MTSAADQLWRWAVTVYARERVSARCLQLQDEHDQCVPLLLWAAWLATHGTALTDATAATAAAVGRAWSETTIVPLRQLRRQMKVPVAAMDDQARLAVRERVKALELEAERHLLNALAQLAGAQAGKQVGEQSGSAAERSSAANLVTAARHWSGAPPPAELSDLAEQLGLSDNVSSGGDNNGL